MDELKIPEGLASKKSDPQAVFSILKKIYEDQMPFDRLLGIKIERINFENVSVRVDMRPEFVGNFVKGILHGGVISSVLDLTGGLIASVGLVKQMERRSVREIIDRFARMGTIDLRVDYLRSGKGKFFRCSGSILKIGNKVAVVRTEFQNDESVLIAAGTGSYILG